MLDGHKVAIDFVERFVHDSKASTCHITRQSCKSRNSEIGE